MERKITSVRALEILDSRGNPTVRVQVTLEDGVRASASVPSGASTGENEALELRDGDKKRYGGKGVIKAVANVNQAIAPKLVGMDPARQAEIDRVLLELECTPNKGKLGANAILGVSMAIARAAARSAGLPLYGAETFHALKGILAKKVYTTSVGDEGGFAPNLKSNDEACEVILEAIGAAGHKPGKDVALALDPAASSCYEGSAYSLAKSGQGKKLSAEMTAFYRLWVEKYPIVSIEDGLAENDWEGFREHTAVLGSRVQIVGDDIYVTNTRFIARGIHEKTTNAVLIKLNQIGTVSETIEAIELCRKAGWGYVISHRSGETEDTFLADFAVGMGGGQIKTGSACRSERIAKYNRLLEIEAELGKAAVFGS